MVTHDSEWLSETKVIKYYICCSSLCSNCWNDTLPFNGVSAQMPWYNVSVRIHMTTISRTLIQNYVPLNSDFGFQDDMLPHLSTLCAARQIIPLFIHGGGGGVTETHARPYTLHVCTLYDNIIGLSFPKPTVFFDCRSFALHSDFAVCIAKKDLESARESYGVEGSGGGCCATLPQKRMWLPFAKWTVCTEQEKAHLCLRMALI